MNFSPRNAPPWVIVLLLIGLAGTIGLAVLIIPAARSEATAPPGPHVDHVTLPLHRTWQVMSVQPYEGLEEIELVKFNWPTEDDAHLAFALTKEGLTVGDQICLDHIRDIDTFWAHPVPEGGCAARTPASRRAR